MSATELIDATRLEQRVKQMYREVALRPDGDFHFEMGRALAQRLGYDRKLLTAVPPRRSSRSPGVGHFFDLASLRPGESVVDLGSGSGTDLFAAAVQVGKRGRVDRHRHDRAAAREGGAAGAPSTASPT